MSLSSQRVFGRCLPGAGAASDLCLFFFLHPTPSSGGSRSGKWGCWNKDGGRGEAASIPFAVSWVPSPQLAKSLSTQGWPATSPAPLWNITLVSPLPRLPLTDPCPPGLSLAASEKLPGLRASELARVPHQWQPRLKPRHPVGRSADTGQAPGRRIAASLLPASPCRPGPKARPFSRPQFPPADSRFREDGQRG